MCENCDCYKNCISINTQNEFKVFLVIWVVLCRINTITPMFRIKSSINYVKFYVNATFFNSNSGNRFKINYE